jgi:hypothetical protein
VQKALCLALAVGIAAFVPTPVSADDSADTTSVNIPNVTVAVTIPTTTTTVPPITTTIAPTTTLPAVDPAVVNYILRTTPPKELIEYYWRDTPDVQTMLTIAGHESSLGKRKRDGTIVTFEACSADNPISSAAGLFQTMGFHRALAESMGLSWANIEGPDCLDDVLLAKQLYNHGKGLGNWKGAY